MGFEFLSDMALGNNENDINDLYSGRKNSKYALLKECPLKVKAQILSTGLSGDTEDLLKNSRPENSKKNEIKINGYPDLVKQSSGQGLPSPWSDFFLPDAQQILTRLPVGSFVLKFNIELIQPFYSSDDISIYPIDNPVKKEKVFTTPYFSASGIKGLLRWAWRMCWGDEKKAAEEKMFGPRKEDLEDDKANQGCFYPYPLFWDGRIGLEVINPHDRSTMTGTTPIKYEVVKSGGKSTLVFVFVNKDNDYLAWLKDAVGLLEPVITALLEYSGFSAKRGAGWGRVTVQKDNCFQVVLPRSVVKADGTHKSSEIEALLESITDDNGNLKDIYDTSAVATQTLVKLTGLTQTKVKKKRNKKELEAEREKLMQTLEDRKSEPDDGSREKKEIIEIPGDNCPDLFAVVNEKLADFDGSSI